MIKIEKQITTTVTQYQAYDGTMFDSEKECEAYDNSAKGIIHAKFKKLIVGEPKDAWSLMGGMDDHDVIAVRMSEEKDVDAVLHFLYYECPWYLHQDREDQRKRIEDIVTKAYKDKDLLLWGINPEKDYYFINSSGNIINNLLSEFE